MTNLLQHHLDQLTKESAIDIQVVQQRPYVSVDKTECYKFGFPSFQAGNGWMAKVHTIDNTNGIYMLRPDVPRLARRTNKPVKYEYPHGSNPRLDISNTAFVPDVSIDAIWTEGLKKVDSLKSHLPQDRYMVTGLINGVYGWLKNRQAIPDLELLGLDGRHNYVLFDSDISTNPAVRFASTWLSDELKKRRASVSIIYLPLVGKKLGADDYFANGGTTDQLLEYMRLSRIDIMDFIDEVSQAIGKPEFHELLTRLVWRIADETDSLKVQLYANEIKSKKILGKTEFMALVRDRINSWNDAKSLFDPMIRDEYIERHDNVAFGLEDWRKYKNGIWQVVNENIVLDEIQKVIEDNAACIEQRQGASKSLRESVKSLAKTRLYEPDDTWNAHDNFLVCRNGTLMLDNRALLPHSPDFYITSGVNYDYNPQATCPNWNKFIADLSDSLGEDVVSFMQEFSGLAITGDCSHEIGLWLKSEPGTGKSTFLEGITGALGTGRTGVLSLAQIEKSRFGLTGIVGKTLMVSTENPADFLQSTYILNSIISGEPITVEAKFKDKMDIVPKCKIIFAMNELPRIANPNDGLFRRIKIIEFLPLDEDKIDITLKDKIKLEGAGILLWMLDGLDRLRKRGKFIIPDYVKEVTLEYKDNSDIPAQFVKDKIVIDKKPRPDGTYHKAYAKAIYDAYKEWCIEAGHKPSSMTRIAQDWKRLGLVRSEADRDSTGKYYPYVELIY